MKHRVISVSLTLRPGLAAARSPPPSAFPPETRISRIEVASVRSLLVLNRPQSAPRPRGRGDCGAVFRLSRRDFLHPFRQPANSCHTLGSLIVKERLQISLSSALTGRRELPVAGRSLGIRGIVLIMPPSINSQLSTLNHTPVITPAAPSGPRAWPHHGARCVAPPSRPGSRSAANPRLP